MLKIFAALFGAIALISGFFMVPKDPVDKNYRYKCYYSEEYKRQIAQQQDEQKKICGASKTKLPIDNKNSEIIDLDCIDTGNYSQNTDYVEQIVQKSGLRKEVEGRLSWLGIDYELSFLNKNTCK